jgi:hypothetical protein
MFDPKSRYAKLDTATLTVVAADGVATQIRYVKRRFLPAGPGQVLAEYQVTSGDRLDNITARYLGDPLQYWRICDANNVLRPEELTENIGGSIEITLPMV